MLIHLWDLVGPNEGKWLCILCTVSACYADAVDHLQNERNQLNRGRGDGVGGSAFGAGFGNPQAERAIYNAQVLLQGRANQLLGQVAPPPLGKRHKAHDRS